jgi:hypothetical protein
VSYIGEVPGESGKSNNDQLGSVFTGRGQSIALHYSGYATHLLLEDRAQRIWTRFSH